MKAVTYNRYGSPNVLQFQDIPKPIPKDDEVLIKVHAAVVTTADVAARKGSPFIARLAFGLFKPKLTILGTELAGQIEAVGQNVEQFQRGDSVFAATGDSFGAHAEYLCLSEDGALAHQPTHTSHEEAAALCEGGLTALPFLRDVGQLRRGQTLLINGASGSVGTAAVQLAKYFGAHVTGVCSTGNLDLVKSLGADRVIDYTQVDFTTTGETYDIIFDVVGNRSFSRCKGSLKPGGIYLLTIPTLAILFQMLWTSKMGNKKAKLVLTGLRDAQEKAQDLVFLKTLIEAGDLKAVIGQRYGLEQMAEAHRYAETGHKRGSAVVVF